MPEFQDRGLLRGRLLERALEIFSVLLDGHSHTLDAFGFMEMHPKTIRRTLQVLERIPALKVGHRLYEGAMYWYTDYKFAVRQAEYKKKRCSGCNTPKPIDEFHKSRQSPDGRKAYCKLCSNAYERNWREQNRVHLLKRYKKRYQRRRKRALENGGKTWPYTVASSSSDAPTLTT